MVTALLGPLLDPLPASASWRHTGLRDGFEVSFCDSSAGGTRLRAQTTAVEDGQPWSVGLQVVVDRSWTTRSATAVAHTVHGVTRAELARDDDGRWTVDGQPRPDLDGCVDVDFESSAVTNTLPLHRLELPTGSPVSVPAAFVRVDATVQRLEQTYELVSVGQDGVDVAYTSSTFDVSCRLRYDRAGLVVDYPGIAVRHA